MSEEIGTQCSHDTWHLFLQIFMNITINTNMINKINSSPNLKKSRIFVVWGDFIAGQLHVCNANSLALLKNET